MAAMASAWSTSPSTAAGAGISSSALTAGEAVALAVDYLAQAAELGDCPMRTSLVARALEAMR